ncbi:MAG: acyl-CoA dehydrogenase [Thermodesulfobacteriota bacterium]
MAAKFASRRNLSFLLYEVFDAASLSRYPYFSSHNRRAFDLVVDSAFSMAKNLMWPVLKEMDENPPELSQGVVKVHPSVVQIMKECGNGGWISASFPEDHGGDQLPLTLSNAARFLFAAANYSLSVYADLSTGAAHLLLSFGRKELQEMFVPKILEGKWQGTMALTEPQAGSSLSDIITTATPQGDGTYRIQGHKIFISAGDHSGVENVVHLMLARIEGAPAGVKGISLFAVPKKRVEKGGKLTGNDITVTQVYHKLGYRGTPLTELAIGEKGDCHGYLVGQENRGLSCMFQMMNEARLEVGLGATGIATAAYYAALDYAQKRPQGRKIGQKDMTLPQITIIEHADVKRMLLFQKAVVEGSLSLLMQCSMYSDLAMVTQGEEKEKYSLLLDLLTPIAKTYPSESGVLSVSAGIQCLGGYGFCDDFPLEQYYRDIRIHPIHEGTTGIQAMDLLGRKVVMKEGRASALFFAEVNAAIAAAGKFPELAEKASRLSDAMERLQKVTMHLIGVAQESGPEAYLADATLYLHFFGLVVMGWQWLVQALAVQKAMAERPGERENDFYRGKMLTAEYFFSYELPAHLGLAARLMEKNPVTLNMRPEFFVD